jgi:hypothetical protein
MSLHEGCREGSLQLRCQRCRVGSVPRSLTTLDEALALAPGVLGKMYSQGLKASSQLNFRPLSGREGSLSSFRRGDVVRRWIWMAGQSILLNLEEGSVLGGIVLLQTRCVFEEVCLPCLFQIVLPVLGQGRLCARIVCHFALAFLT